MKPLGVGVVYVTELLPLLREAGDVLSVVEVEPQTLWRRRNDCRGGIGLDSDSVDALHRLPQAKIAHGIGMPIGGSARPSPEELDCLARSLEVIAPAWFSEHLSFNRTDKKAGGRRAGFLLPPQQNADAVAVASHNIRTLAARVGLPTAFETGVNYLKTDAEEMQDGEFFAAVAEHACCGIVLDLHNLWVNERNGRQGWRDVLAALPAERVWEIHLAGGTELNGFSLDSHADLIPDALLEELPALLNRLPCVGAVIFEILPAYIARVGLDAIARQLEQLRIIWDRRSVPPATRTEAVRQADKQYAASLDRVRASELALISQLNSSRVPADAGVALYRRLIADFRSGTITQCLPGSIILLYMTLGRERCESLMAQYLKCSEPQEFAEDEALQFCRFVSNQQIESSYLRDVMEFESAIIDVSCSGRDTIVKFDHDPELLYASLLQSRLPILPISPSYLNIQSQAPIDSSTTRAPASALRVSLPSKVDEQTVAP